MNKTAIYILTFLCFCFLSIAQENKTANVIIKRNFQEDLSAKYNSKEFVYTEPEPIKESKPINSSSISSLIDFMFKVFPFIIISLAVLLIARALINKEGFWLFGKSPDKALAKLELVDEEEIENINLETRLTDAISNKNYRLATRYYYLITLKKLANRNIIKIDKDKTNSDYLFEIKDQQARKEFSYLSYLYDYVWYGEFPIDEFSFLDIENSFKNYNKSF